MAKGLGITKEVEIRPDRQRVSEKKEKKFNML